MATTYSILAALVTGGLLGLSGAVLQSILRNPLAEPYMLGLTGGASLLASVVLHLGWVAIGAWVLPTAAFAGCLFSLLLVSGTAWCANRRAGFLAESARLNAPGNIVILAGYATGAFTCSLQMLVLSFATPETFATLNKWLWGDLRHAPGSAIVMAGFVLCAALTVLLLLARRLDVLSLGADRAECLGINTRALVLVALGLTSVATATAVSVAGAIGFAGLVAPHAARRLVGSRHHRLLPASALTGALLLMLAEIVGAHLPGNLSAGVVAALFGAPVFLFLLFPKPDK